MRLRQRGTAVFIDYSLRFIAAQQFQNHFSGLFHQFFPRNLFCFNLVLPSSKKTNEFFTAFNSFDYGIYLNHDHLSMFIWSFPHLIEVQHALASIFLQSTTKVCNFVDGQFTLNLAVCSVPSRLS